MAATLGGLDVLVFTGGVGQNSSAVRDQVCGGLAFLGVELDDERNCAAGTEATISATGSRVATLVVTAREDLQIAREARRVLNF
jgi:acetate kinase